jgi:hypothetical protein
MQKAASATDEFITSCCRAREREYEASRRSMGHEFRGNREGRMAERAAAASTIRHSRRSKYARPT